MAAKLTLLVGPARSGKTRRLLSRYRELLRSRAAAGLCGGGLWLAPNQRSVTKLLQTLSCETGGAFLVPGLHTFAGYAESIVAASARRIRSVSRVQKRVLLGRVVDKALADDKLSYFASVARTSGFIAQLDEWIAERKRSDIWADDFRRSAESLRDRDLALLYGQYQRLLIDADLYDAEGRFWAARENLQQTAGTLQHEYQIVVVDGFSDFTAAQYDILRTLAERSAEMVISLVADPEALLPADPTSGRALLFAKVRRTYERLQKVLPGLSLEFVPPDGRDTDSLRRAERLLFNETTRELEQSDSATEEKISIEIVAASGVHNEIEEIASSVKELLLEGRARPQDCLVVHRHLAASAQRVAEVFDDFGLPHWIETRPRLSTAALVRAVMLLLRLKTQDWPFRLLLEITGNRNLSAFDEPHGMEPRVCVEQAIRAAQLPTGREQLLKQLGNSSAVGPDDVDQRAQQSAIALANLNRLSTCLDDLPLQATLCEWAEHLTELLTRLGAISGEHTSPDWSVLINALHSLNQADSWINEQSSTLEISKLLDLLELIADEQHLPAKHDETGRVRILTAESARHESVRHVFLAGLSEDAFSVIQPENRSDSEDQSVDTLLDLSEPMFTFYSLVTRASESLTISYPAMDDKGQQLPPSPLLTELERCFLPAAIPIKTQQLAEAILVDELPLSRSEYRQAAVDRALDKNYGWLAGLLSQPDLTGAGILGAVGSVISRANRNEFGEYEGLMLGEEAREALAIRFGGSHLWSPSQLEGYAACPFRFFAEQLLSLEPLGELTLASDAGRRGSLLHQVLAKVHQELSTQAARSPDDDSWQADLAERFLKALDAEVAATPLGGLEQSLREIERRQIAAWSTQYAQQESDYQDRWRDLDEPLRAEHFEVRFGPKVQSSANYPEQALSTPQPFELDLNTERIRITGQIDRIDIGRVGEVTVFNVIDYKSGREVRLKDEAVQAGRQLQLPLYAIAAEELLLADRHAEALAAGYWSIQGRGFEKGALELRRAEGRTLACSEKWQNIQPQILATIQELVAGIRAGQFPVYNEDQHCTRWCPQSTICRVAQIRSLDKQWPPESPVEATSQ